MTAMDRQSRRRGSVTRAGGFEAFRRSLEEDDEIAKEVNDGARAMQRYARQAIRGGGKSGETYAFRGKDRKFVRGKAHRASAPGEAPANMTGTLAGRIVAKLAKTGLGTRRTAIVFPTAPHAHLLEFGTVKMKARPFFRPAFLKVEQQVRQGLKAATRRMVDQAARKAQRELARAGQTT